MKYINISEEIVIVSSKKVGPGEEIEIDNIIRDERFEIVDENKKDNKKKKNK